MGEVVLFGYECRVIFLIFPINLNPCRSGFLSAVLGVDTIQLFLDVIRNQIAFIDVLVEDVITLIDQFRLLRIVRMLLPLLFAVPKQERACLTGKQVLLRLLRGMYVRWNWGSVAISSLVTSGFLLLHDSCRIILIRNLESFIEDEFPRILHFVHFSMGKAFFPKQICNLP